MTSHRTGSDGLRAARLLLVGLACCFACAARIGSNGSPSGSSPAGGAAGSSGNAGSSQAVAGSHAGATNAGGPHAGATSVGTTNGGASAGSDAPSGAPNGGGGDAKEAAGASGIAGTSGFAECHSDQDCEIAKDCCSCQAVPKGSSSPACKLPCESGNACETKGLSAVAQCTLGRCTLATSCDRRRALCKSLPPSCPPGQTISVTELGCWGACLAATECSEVTDCDACGDAQCVKFPDPGGTTIRCIARRPECEDRSSCECLSPCGGFSCSEQDGEIRCFAAAVDR